MLKNKLKITKKITQIMAVVTGIVMIGTSSIVGHAAIQVTVGAERKPTQYVRGWIAYTEKGHQLRIDLHYTEKHKTTGNIYKNTLTDVKNGDYTKAAGCKRVDEGYKFTDLTARGYLDGKLVKEIRD